MSRSNSHAAYGHIEDDDIGQVEKTSRLEKARRVAERRRRRQGTEGTDGFSTTSSVYTASEATPSVVRSSSARSRKDLSGQPIRTGKHVYYGVAPKPLADDCRRNEPPRPLPDTNIAKPAALAQLTTTLHDNIRNHNRQMSTAALWDRIRWAANMVLHAWLPSLSAYVGSIFAKAIAWVLFLGRCAALAVHLVLTLPFVSQTLHIVALVAVIILVLFFIAALFVWVLYKGWVASQGFLEREWPWVHWGLGRLGAFVHSVTGHMASIVMAQFTADPVDAASYVVSSTAAAASSSALPVVVIPLVSSSSSTLTRKKVRPTVPISFSPSQLYRYATDVSSIVTELHAKITDVPRIEGYGDWDHRRDSRMGYGLATSLITDIIAVRDEFGDGGSFWADIRQSIDDAEPQRRRFRAAFTATIEALYAWAVAVVEELPPPHVLLQGAAMSGKDGGHEKRLHARDRDRPDDACATATPPSWWSGGDSLFSSSSPYSSLASSSASSCFDPRLVLRELLAHARGLQGLFAAAEKDLSALRTEIPSWDAYRDQDDDDDEGLKDEVDNNQTPSPSRRKGKTSSWSSSLEQRICDFERDAHDAEQRLREIADTRNPWGLNPLEDGSGSSEKTGEEKEEEASCRIHGLADWHILNIWASSALACTWERSDSFDIERLGRHLAEDARWAAERGIVSLRPLIDRLSCYVEEEDEVGNKVEQKKESKKTKKKKKQMKEMENAGKERGPSPCARYGTSDPGPGSGTGPSRRTAKVNYTLEKMAADRATMRTLAVEFRNRLQRHYMEAV